MAGEKFVKYKNGKFSTDPNGGGGGGSSTFSGLEDVEFTNLQDGQVPKYNSSTQKWENANESGGGGTVTDVEVDGVSVVDPQTGVANITMPTPPTIPVTDVKVNGASVVDDNKEAQIKSYEEVTQSEYNALPDSKLNDGILYAIKDVGGSDGFPPLIYSKEEREVGVWYDGRPLYMKTIEATATQVAAGVYTDTDFTNLGSGFIVAGYYDCVNVKVGLNQYENTSTYTRTGFRGPNHATYPNSLYLINSGYNNNGAVVTVCYTKTTDTPGSGTWTTQGALAHHYSTDEHIIGTWIDGKPIYERTIHTSNNLLNSGTLVVETLANTINVIGIEGFAYSTTSSGYMRPLPFAGQNNDIRVDVSNYDLKIITYADWSTYKAYITIRYTKTTD